MKKRVLALVLATTMVASLAACGSSASDTTADAAAEEETTEEAAAEEEAPAEEAAEVTYPELTISLTLSNNEADTGGLNASYFMDYIEEHSNGAITFERYFGGTLCDSSEVLSFVGTDAVDMCMTGTAQLSADLPLTNFPSFVYGSQEAAVDYANYIAFENEETAQIITDEMASNGVVAIGLNAGGSNAYFFKDDYATLADATAAGLVLGVGSNLSCYEELGFNVTEAMPWDCYDQLSKGVIDCTTMATAPGVSMSWQEVAPYVLCNNQYSFGNWFLINKEVWDALDADTQALFYEAAEATCAYSIDLYNEEGEAAVETIEAAGGKFSYMTDEESAEEAEIFFTQSYADCRAAAETAGKTDEMETILAATTEYLGLDVQ